MTDLRRMTIFCDIDGVLVRHCGSQSEQLKHWDEMDALPDVLKRIDEWDRAGHLLILTTGRKECLKDITEKQLSKLGIYYDRIIYGITSGPRVLINDIKPDNPERPVAIAYNLPRNEGLTNVGLPT